jgi:protein gp37
MAGASHIEWTGHTWNPIAGCSILSPGCTHCYAMKDAWRFHHNPQLPHYRDLTKKVNGKPVWTGKVALGPDSILLAPLKRSKPTTYFVNSMSDLFHENVPDAWIDRIFAVMALCPQHTFQVLTKRAERMREYCRPHAGTWCPTEKQKPLFSNEILRDLGIARVGPLPNVWLGVSTERQQEADERIPHLIRTPAAVRFISAEPLLGPIDLTVPDIALGCHTAGFPDLDWIIVGGESGRGARPMNPAWVRSLRDQCADAGVAFFFKQWGEFVDGYADLRLPPNSNVERTRVRDDQVHHWSDTVASIRVGKKAAGRLLDGIEHNAMPERAA